MRKRVIVSLVYLSNYPCLAVSLLLWRPLLLSMSLNLSVYLLLWLPLLLSMSLNHSLLCIHTYQRMN